MELEGVQRQTGQWPVGDDRVDVAHVVTELDGLSKDMQMRLFDDLMRTAAALHGLI